MVDILPFPRISTNIFFNLHKTTGAHQHRLQTGLEMGGRSRLDSTLLLGARIPGVKFLKDLSIHKHIDWLGRTTRRDPIAPEKRQFHKFFELPREIRDEIYAYYFSGDIGLSSGLQPHSQYAAGILLANHQLYDEARPIMFKAAAFTINLAPKYARNPKRDYAYHCDHRIGRGSFFTGSQEVFVLFNRVSYPPSQSRPMHREHREDGTFADRIHSRSTSSSTRRARVTRAPIGNEQAPSFC